MKYYLQTSLGISSTSYSHSSTTPIYGVGQGAGNSPAIWCTISSLLFDVYANKAHGATFYSPDQSLSCAVPMVGFNDDTCGSTNSFLANQDTPLSYYSNLAAADAQRWNNLLQLTGGALQSTKCSYHFMAYTFTSRGLPQLISIPATDPNCIRFNNNTTITPLMHLSNFAPHKTLGVWKAPAGTANTAYKVLMEKSITLSSIAKLSPLTPDDAWTFYHAITIPSLTYSLPSLTLKKTQLHTIQKPLKNAILLKCGFNWNLPNVIVYGPPTLGGLGF